jgi:membrane protease YdiL (CAAX protease family)
MPAPHSAGGRSQSSVEPVQYLRVASLLAHLFVGNIVLIAPSLSRFKYRQLQQKLAAGDLAARRRFYRIGVVQQILRTMIVLAICLLGSIPLRALGLTAPGSWQNSGQSLAIFVGALAASVVLFRYRGDWQLRRLMKMVGALIPASVRERRWFAVIALGAGVSEEVVFRGFLLFYLNSYASLSSMEMIIISSLVFGFCHIYQGWFGVLGTSFAGLCFAFLYLSSGSLLVPIIVHAAIDLRLLVILTPERLVSLQETKQTTIAASASN